MAKDIQSYYQNHSSIDINQYLSHISQLGYQMYLVASDGNGIFYGGDFRKKELDQNIIQEVVSGKTYHGIDQFPSKLFVTGFFDNVLKNTIGVPVIVDGAPHALFIRPNLEVQFGEMRIFFAILLTFTILLSVIFVVISTRYIVKPISKLTEATKKIAKGNYNIQLQVNRRDEIGQLASHFSLMTKSLEQLEAMRQEFVSNVSHEIQSPLASIQGFSQTLQLENLRRKRESTIFRSSRMKVAVYHN